MTQCNVIKYFYSDIQQRSQPASVHGQRAGKSCTYIGCFLDLFFSEHYVISRVITQLSKHSLDLRSDNVAVLVQIEDVKDFLHGLFTPFRLFRSQFCRTNSSDLNTKARKMREIQTDCTSIGRI